MIFGKAWETRSQLNTVTSGIVSVVPRECSAQVKLDSLLTLRFSTNYSTGEIECSHSSAIFQ